MGLPIPPELRPPIAAWQERVKGQFGAWRVVPFANWHVTLHFLGEADAIHAPPLEKWVRNLSIPKLPGLTWDRWFAFPKPGAATTAGLAAGSPAAWDRWVKELADGLLQVGFRTEKRAFVPHLTLFRGRKEQAVTLPAELPNLTFRPLKLCLYESQLTPTGSNYLVRVEKALVTDAKALSKALKEI